MKKMTAIILALVLCLGLFAGCKKNQAAPAGSPAASVPGTTQTSGNLTVVVPDGWNLVANETNPDQLHLCKGGSSPSDSAYVKLTGRSSLPAEGTCTDVQALEEQTYGQLSWSGFSGSKPNGSAVYLLTQTETGSILATLWYTEATGAISVEDKDVQAILSSVVLAAAPAPAPVEPPPAVDPTAIAGDWSGSMIMDECSGDFDNQNSTTFDCVARFVQNEDGSIIPYIGIAQDGGTITDLTANQADGENMLTLSGIWREIPFSSTPALEGSTLKLEITISSGSGNALLIFTMKALTDGSFESKASQLGCTGYPTAG